MPDMDMKRMQEEAARRAREMQSRARQGRQTGHRAGSQSPGKSPPPPPPPEAPPAPPAEPLPEPLLPPETGGEPPASLLEELFKDRERTVLLALLILLGAEGGNNELMFALLFLLM